MFDILRTYSAAHSVIGASSGHGKDTKACAVQGIVKGHAYTVVRVVVVDDVRGPPLRMLQLRNPWGHWEWTGPWSDSSEEWARYPDVKRALLGASGVADDGAFWMRWEDFLTHFTGVDICHRATGLDELAIDLHEEHGCCGPALGCLKGCGTYWCLCAGCRALACASESSAETMQGRQAGCLTSAVEKVKYGDAV